MSACLADRYIPKDGNRPPCSRQGLPSGQVTLARCGLLLSHSTKCAMLSQTNWAHSFHPYLARRHGGIVSVALSLGLPPVAVSNCLVLCCPDFPLGNAKRSLSSLTLTIIPRLPPKNYLCSSRILLTMASASLLYSRPTCVKVTLSNSFIKSSTAEYIGHRSLFFTW